MSHFSYNDVPLQRGMMVFQIGLSGNDHILFRFKVQEILADGLVKVASISDDPKIIQDALKIVPAKNLHTSPKELIENRLELYNKQINIDLPAKINNLNIILDKINKGLPYTIMGSDLSSEIEI